MNEELKEQLTGLGFGDEQIAKLSEQGVQTDAEMAMLSENEIREITGCTVIAAKKAAAAFTPKPTEAEVASSTAAIQNVLPQLPDDKSFLEMLKVGGVLKVDRTNVIAAMRAAIASDVGLYQLPERLIQRMEEFAMEQEEPVGEAFYKLQRQLTERRYGDVLAAIGATGSFVSEKRKRETLQRLDTLLWPALRSFNKQLRAWVESWSQGAANPAAMMMAMAVSSGGMSGVMPPGMLQPPDTAVLRDEGEAVINSINKVFAGTGIPVARALAYDAMRIREVLEDPNLPSTVGAATRDQMLKMLGIDVGADYVRLEQNVTRFALAIMELPKVASGSEELTYFSAMYTLGISIPWDKLGKSPNGSATIFDGSNRPRSSKRASAYVRGDDLSWDDHVDDDPRV